MYLAILVRQLVFKNAYQEQMIAQLAEQLSFLDAVQVIMPGDSLYPQARLVYNRMHDVMPLLIVRTLNIKALRLVISFSQTNSIQLAIRGGGHHIGGFGTIHQGILVDFSSFKAITIDAKNNIASIEPGATLADVDQCLTAAGYVLPTGTVSQTGVAGLTLGGGIGWLTGKFGLTCDNLCGADVLLADGSLVQAESIEHKELLWALRGGGGNFGMVFNFRYKIYPLPKTICGMGIVKWEHAVDVLNKLMQFLQDDCPSSLTIAPIFAKNAANEPYFRIDFCCADGTDVDLTKLISLSPQITWNAVKAWSFVDWQKEFDDTFLPPMRGYWKACYLEKLTPEVMVNLLHCFVCSPSKRCSILIEHLHGAFKHYDEETSAFPLRQTNFGILLSARWESADDDAQYIDWVRHSFALIDPDDNSKTYINYTHADDHRAVKTLMSDTSFKLAKVKAAYDPSNFFKHNHNVSGLKSNHSPVRG